MDGDSRKTDIRKMSNSSRCGVHVMISTLFFARSTFHTRNDSRLFFYLKLWRRADASDTQSTIFDNSKLWSTSRHICCIVSCSQKKEPWNQCTVYPHQHDTRVEYVCFMNLCGEHFLSVSLRATRSCQFALDMHRSKKAFASICHNLF